MVPCLLSLRSLHRDDETYKQGKYFWIFTPEKNYSYEIISAYTTGVNSDTYTLFKGPGEEFEKYLETIRGYSEIRTDDTDLTSKDKIVTLSTCTGNEATRYVVQGRTCGCGGCSRIMEQFLRRIRTVQADEENTDDISLTVFGKNKGGFPWMKS